MKLVKGCTLAIIGLFVLKLLGVPISWFWVAFPVAIPFIVGGVFFAAILWGIGLALCLALFSGK